MKSADFSAWLSAISAMSGAQRDEALAALAKAAADADPLTKTRGKRAEDALGTALLQSLVGDAHGRTVV